MDSNALLIAVFGCITVVFLVLALTSGGAGGRTATAARQRLEGFTRNQQDLAMEPVAPSFGARVLSPMLHGAANSLGRVLPRSMLSGVEKSLVIAGEPMTLS